MIFLPQIELKRDVVKSQLRLRNVLIGDDRLLRDATERMFAVVEQIVEERQYPACGSTVAGGEDKDK